MTPAELTRLLALTRENGRCDTTPEGVGDHHFNSGPYCDGCENRAWEIEGAFPEVAAYAREQAIMAGTWTCECGHEKHRHRTGIYTTKPTVRDLMPVSYVHIDGQACYADEGCSCKTYRPLEFTT